MRLPRDLSGDDLIKRLRSVGYEATRQTGSHIRLTRKTDKSEHHITIPRHSPLRVGTLNQIVSDIAAHLQIGKEELLKLLSS